MADTLLDQRALKVELSRLDDGELSKLEDDLEFCRVSGVPSMLILSIIDRVAGLDQDWQKLFEWKLAKT